jgi:hypothetical protein
MRARDYARLEKFSSPNLPSSFFITASFVLERRFTTLTSATMRFHTNLCIRGRNPHKVTAAHNIENMPPSQWEALARGENQMGEALKGNSSLMGYGQELDQVRNLNTSKEFVVIMANYTLTNLYSGAVLHKLEEPDR